MTPHTSVPRVGMFATVRNRRGIVAAVEPFDGDEGRLHLVHLEYKDDQIPHEEQLLWELEPRGTVLEPTALPRVDASSPMPAEDFDALLRAARWTAISPFLDPDGEGPLDRMPVASPFHGAIQAEDFQLVPLLKALRMPRVNLLIADDVGLGKTVEAGLILTELLLRRRIQRVLVLTPASLRTQWKEEMWDKFSLPFDLVDRAEAHALRRRLGMDANPWRAFSRIIASYHYLRQPDVLDQFLVACRTPEGSPHLPWDLLIVDECHNLMPSPFGEDSDLCNMLRLIAPQFEHRLFLSATPHNGHTRSFTGLLEILDPVRFSQTDELKPAERERVQQIVLRRLKREINERSNPPRFCHRRPPQGLELALSPEELALSGAFDRFRTSLRELIRSGERRKRRAGTFAVEMLGKRLLSCPIAFAESWRRCKAGLAEAQRAEEAEVDAARRDVERDTGDDRETESKAANAATVVGAWLKNVATDVEEEIAALDRAVKDLGLRAGDQDIAEQDPVADSRFDALVQLIESLVRDGGGWRDDERLVVFTEYKTTLDYLTRRLRERYEEDRVLTLFGGMDEVERDLIKQAFNDPGTAVRVLVATDAAAEGLNLQTTARYLLHFDCPWNPSKLEQRNGRIDRHGQARDVVIHHFFSDQDQDLKFLAHILRKANEIREDLGSANELFDDAAHRRLVQGEDARVVQSELDQRVTAARGRAEIEADATVGTGVDGVDEAARLQALAEELDLTPPALRDTLEAAMAIGAGRPQLDCTPVLTCRLLNPGLPGWGEVVDESLRRRTGGSSLGPVPRLAFSAAPFMEEVGPREVFRPRPDLLLMHLSHPMMQRALGSLTRRRFPGTGDEVSRWTVRRGTVPDGVDAVVVLSVEELAVNELRETFHHWVRPMAFPVRRSSLGEPLAHAATRALRDGAAATDEAARRAAAEVYADIEPDLKRALKRHSDALTDELERVLAEVGERARRDEDERYRSRQGEVSALITESTIAKLEREIAALRNEKRQGLLFDQDSRLDELDRSIESRKEEIARRTRHYEEVRQQLERERDRILRYLLPKRHAMNGTAQVFPVVLEILLPEVTR
jgi:superfamily II DNA or RNA helicase